MSGDMNFSMQGRSNNGNTSEARFFMNMMNQQSNSNNRTGHNMSSSAASISVSNVLSDHHYTEADVWVSRIIVSALEDIAFAVPANSKISPKLLQYLQITLTNLRTEFQRSPFLKTDGDENVTFENNKFNVGSLVENHQLELSNSSLNDSYRKPEPNISMKCIPSSDFRLIRALVSIYIRNLAKGIINMFQPLMDKQNIEAENTGSEVTNEEILIRHNLGEINSLLDKMKADSQSLDHEIFELRKERDFEIKNYDENINEFEMILSQLVELTLHEKQTEKTVTYLDYLKRETENLVLKGNIAELEEDIEANPEELMYEMEEKFNKLKLAIEKLENENATIEKKLSDYKALGQDYINILEEYKVTEEEIKTKEWVKEQLVSTQCEQSLNESFF